MELVNAMEKIKVCYDANSPAEYALRKKMNRQDHHCHREQNLKSRINNERSTSGKKTRINKRDCFSGTQHVSQQFKDDDIPLHQRLVNETLGLSLKFMSNISIT
jgi:hypothetical protein